MPAASAVAASAFELHAGALRLALRPDLGGAIAGLWHRDRRCCARRRRLRSAAPRQAGCFPLVPYSNRLAFRRFRWKGADHTTQPNFEDSPHSLHGVGWQRPWDDRLLERGRRGAAPRARRRRRLALRLRGEPVLHPRTRRDARADGLHQPGRAARSRSGSAGTPTFRQARAQPAAHRAGRALGRRRQRAADPQGRAAGHRRRRRASRFRQLLRGLARAGAHPRRTLLAAAAPRRCVTSSSTPRRTATTSASSRSAT